MSDQAAFAQAPRVRLGVRLLRSEYLVLLLSGVAVAAMAPFTPGLLTGANLVSVLLTLLPLFLVATGQTLVLISGGIDLSVGSAIALCSVTGAALMNPEMGLAYPALSVPAGLLAMLVTGAAVGACNGLAIAKLRMPPFIVTLTTMMFFSGLAIWLTRSKNIGPLPVAFNAIGGNLLLALPVSALAGLMIHLVLSRSVWGRWLYAVGHNPRTARLSGVPVARVTVSAYLLSGIFAALASALYTGQAESGSPVLGQRLLLDIVGATVIGGTSLFGGKGKILWTLFGVLFIKLIDNALNLLDLSYFSIMITKGAVILLAAVLDAMRNKTPA